MLSTNEKKDLEAYLSGSLGLGPVSILKVDRIAMGQSRAMYRIDIEHGVDGPKLVRRIVVRVEQWGLLGTDSSDEVATMRVLHSAGFPVAKILDYYTENDILGQPFFVMEYVDASEISTPEGLADYVPILHRLHQLDWHACEMDSYLEVPEGPRNAALQTVERWYRIYRWGLVGEPSPLLEAATEWLRRNAPETERLSVVHGDPGPGNYMEKDGKVAALVDFEFTSIGDPEEDWAYLIAMRGAAAMSEDEWVAYIADKVGVKIDRERLNYWKAVNFLKGTCIDQTAMKIYMDQSNPAPNMLMIGTGVHLGALKRLVESTIAYK